MYELNIECRRDWFNKYLLTQKFDFQRMSYENQRDIYVSYFEIKHEWIAVPLADYIASGVCRNHSTNGTVGQRNMLSKCS